MSRGANGLPVVLILTPVYNEADGLAAYEDAVQRTLFARTDCAVRVLFIDDGSEDDSWPRIRAAAGRDARFRGIRLSRNYGSRRGGDAGLRSPGSSRRGIEIHRCLATRRRHRLGKARDPGRVVAQSVDEPHVRAVDSPPRDAAAVEVHHRQLSARRSRSG
ncbi:MAG: hypothetical protein DMF88_04265 [Acidobacteria bacterium]|nr:MAG: hypothetical protein DMF88_04265 [Acidobacteriota bacterium]